MTGHELTKDMVDLIMKIKKHLRSEYQITIALADPELLGKLVKLKNMDDHVLQGMLTFLMALAGPEWSARFAEQDATSEPSMEKKRLFGFWGKPTNESEEIHGSHPGEPHFAEQPAKPRKVRYYRGQPIAED